MRSVFPLFFVLAACGTLTLDDGRAELVGRLVDRTGAPVVGAHVMLIRDRRPAVDTRTGADGRFVLASAPGPAALFALADELGDDGAWRDGLNLRAAGRTDVGELELEKVWAHPDVLWLRGAGFDEQLTRPEDGLEYLWGGHDGEPLLAVKYLRTHVQVFRVLDDGTPVLLLDEPRVDPFAAQPMVGEPPPPVLTLQGTRDARGQPRLLLVNGGFTWVSAAGTVSSPVTRLRWLELERAATVLDVNVASGAWSEFVPTRGALVVADGRSTWFDLASGRQVQVPADLTGPLVSLGDGVVVLAADRTSLTAWRIDPTGEVAHGPPVPRSSGTFFQTLTRGTDEVLTISHDDFLSITRFDARTLEGREERLTLPADRVGFTVLPACLGFGKTPVTVLLAGAEDLVAVRVDAQLEQQQWALEAPLFLSSGCTLDDGFWGATSSAPRVAVRAQGAALEATPLSNDTAVWGLGARPLVSRLIDGVRTTRLGRDGWVSPTVPIGRSPFLASVRQLADELPDDGSFIATGLVGQGETALFRVRP